MVSLNKSKCTEGLRCLQQDLTCKSIYWLSVLFFFNLAANLTKSYSFLQTDYTLHVDVLMSYLTSNIICLLFVAFYYTNATINNFLF